MSIKNENMFEVMAEMTKIGNRAVHRAQEENRKQGIPNVYAKRGQIYYQLPDGRITTEKAEVNYLNESAGEYREKDKKSDNG